MDRSDDVEPSYTGSVRSVCLSVWLSGCLSLSLSLPLCLHLCLLLLEPLHRVRWVHAKDRQTDDGRDEDRILAWPRDGLQRLDLHLQFTGGRPASTSNSWVVPFEGVRRGLCGLFCHTAACFAASLLTSPARCNLFCCYSDFSHKGF